MNGAEKQAVVGLLDRDSRPGVAAGEDRLTIVQPQPTADLAAGVALEAVTFQNGEDVLLEEGDLRGIERFRLTLAPEGSGQGEGCQGQRKDKHHHGRSKVAESHWRRLCE